MKKLLLLPLLLSAVFAFAACGGSDDDPPKQEQEQEENGGQQGSEGSEEEADTPTSGSRCLVVYASRSGKTEQVAQLIKSTLNCDILEVEPQTPYDDDYSTMLRRGQDELAAIEEGQYPEIKTEVDNFDNYDLIIVGYPIWYGSMATPMQAFLHNHATKLAGKRVALFATSGSSGITGSVSVARSLCSGSTIVEQYLLLTSSTLSQMTTLVPQWLEQIGANQAQNSSGETEETASLKMNIIVNGQTITATMEDNAAARDLLSRLPLDVTLNDYNNTTEKIFYPNPALTTEGVTGGCAPTPGDITIYEPWGNVAIFCKSWSYSSDLIKIGHIDGDGINVLTVDGDIQVRMERQ